MPVCATHWSDKSQNAEGTRGLNSPQKNSCFVFGLSKMKASRRECPVSSLPQGMSYWQPPAGKFPFNTRQPSLSSLLAAKLANHIGNKLRNIIVEIIVRQTAAERD